MTKPFLILNIPGRGLAAGTPVVASKNPVLLRLFKRLVLDEWARRSASPADEALAEIDQLEFQKLKATLDLLIPDNGGPAEVHSGEGGL